MASLEKLSILGIRSFGTQSEQILTFEKPLTLILGDNGCGKSTIIECLRYVTAQKEPSGKGTFIHDPFLTNSATVKAFVKLTLKDAKGREVGLAKNSQSTRKQNGITSKSLDSAISYWSEKEKKIVSISNRCVDFTPEIMRIMGVSKAILENVIFCTQEDSHWPLETDQKLKEKFDQIFESDKYNKCVKKVQEERKQLNTEKKVRETELKHLKEKKQLASRLRKDLEKKEEEVESLKNELVELDASLEPIREKLLEIDQKERKLSKIHRDRENKSAEIQLVEKTEKELREKIKKAASEFIGSDEDLEQALLSCDVETSNENDLKKDLAKTRLDEENVSRNKSSDLALIGQITKLIEINDKKVTEKNSMLLQLATKCGLPKSKSTLDDVSNAINDKKKELMSTLEDQETEQENLQTEVTKARDEMMSLKNEFQRKNNELDSLIQEKSKINQDLKNLESSQVRMSKVNDELNEVSELLANHVGKVNADGLKSELANCQSSLEECEHNLADAENELKILRQHSETGSKLNLKRDELDRKKTEMARLRKTHQATFVEILGNVPEFGFKRAINSQACQFSDDSRELRNNKTVLEEEITTCKNRVLSIGDLLKKKRSDLQKFEDQVNELTGGDELNETVTSEEITLNDYQNEKGTLSSSKAIFEKFIKELETKPCCPLCKRDFGKGNESVMLIDELNHEIRNAPAKLEKLNQSVVESQKKLRSLIPLKAQQDAMEKLKNEEIPALVKEESEMKISIGIKRKELDRVKEQLIEKERNLDTCTTMLGDMALLDQLLADVLKIEKDVENLVTELPDNWTKDLLGNAEERRNKLNTERKTMQDKKEEIQRNLNDFNNTLHQLQTQKNKLAEEKFLLRSQSGQQKQQEDRLMELERIIPSLKTDVETIKKKIQELEINYGTLDSGLKERIQQHKRIVNEKREFLDELSQKLKNISRIDLEIKEFERNQETDKLSELKDKIKEYDSELKMLKLHAETILSKLGDLSAIVVRRHELEDNKSLRMKIAEKNVLQKQYDELNSAFGDLNYKAIDREKTLLKHQEDEISNKKAHNFGKRGEIERQIKDLKKDLETRYNNVDEAFKKELIELKIAEALSVDLHRYATAMEWAMNAYHQRQMKKVNGIIREYWHKIYQGNDIDFIEIHSGGSECSETRRVYNYKLVQIKGDVRLDMRNRCSAGQKMLASLIIRMALAEVFSNNCGILTLDEPTTNLDRKNIRYLARTLFEIIQTKQSMHRSNFQLIVITHDKDFIKHLTSDYPVEKFIEVSRDRDGRSKLTVKTAENL